MRQPGGLDVEAVDAGGERQVLHRAELLEERRVDADPVDQALDLQLVAHDVVAEDLDPSGVEGQQARDEADERRLARPVRAEHAVDVAALETHRHVHDRLDGHLVVVPRRTTCSRGRPAGQGSGSLPAARSANGRRLRTSSWRTPQQMAATRGALRGPVAQDRRHTTKPRADGPRLPASVSGGDAGETYLRVRPARVRTSTLPWACAHRAAVSIRWPRVAEFDPAVHLWCRRSTGGRILGKASVHVKADCDSVRLDG